MFRNSFKIIALLTVFLIFIPIFSARGVQETEETLKPILDANPDAIILDIRWQQVYNEGHFKGAVLIDSSLSLEAQQAQARSILLAKQANASSVIITLCNCPDGHFAREMETYLEGQGYSNVHHLVTSFSLWKDYSYLVQGSTPAGETTLTEIPTAWAGGSNPLNDIGFLLMIVVAGGVGVYFIYYTTQKPISTEKLKQSMEKSEEKKGKELQEIKDLVSSKASESSSKKKSHPKRRR